MKIAIMHYHLRPGGVTTVIRDQVAALRGRGECIVLTGEPPSGGLDPELAAAARVVSGIGYADGRPDARSAADGIRDAMMNEWGAPADLLHVHNPTLGKNPSLPDTLRRLQEEGIGILAQVHDLAEEGRPSSYLPIIEEYPQDCHYAVINSRDRDLLVAAGLRQQGIHLLGNVVRPLAAPSRPPRRAHQGKSLELVYPVRAIRRKNIGEAILLAALLQGRLTLTLPPRNEADLERYGLWKDFVRALDLPIRFEAGLDRSLVDLMGEADYALSTSLNEGFGFALLEPWTMGVAVGGRRIPHVCGDFERAGVSFPSLYESLPIPTDWFDMVSFAVRWTDALVSAFRSFGKDLSESAVSGAWSEMCGGGLMDFGLLDEKAQREVIAHVFTDRGARGTMESREAGVLRRGFAEPDLQLIEHNKSVILESYGLERYSRLLGDVYHATCTAPLRQRINRRTLLDSLLDPRRFRMMEQR